MLLGSSLSCRRLTDWASECMSAKVEFDENCRFPGDLRFNHPVKRRRFPPTRRQSSFIKRPFSWILITQIATRSREFSAVWTSAQKSSAAQGRHNSGFNLIQCWVMATAKRKNLKSAEKWKNGSVCCCCWCGHCHSAERSFMKFNT